MGLISSIPRPELVNLETSTQEINRVNSSSDEKVSSIAKDRISTLGRIFRVTLRLTLAVILLPAFLLKSIYDMALLVIKGKKPEQKIKEKPNLMTESNLIIKEPGHDNSKDLALDKSDIPKEIISPLPTYRGCYEEKQKELEALLNPFVDKKEIEKQTPPSNQPSFSLSDIFGYFKPLIFSTNKKSSERDLDELRDKFNQMELNETPDLQKEEVKQKKVRFEDEAQQASSPLKPQILYSFISDAQKIDVVEKKEKQAPKKPEPEQKQPVRTSARLAEKKEKSLAPLVQTPPKKKDAPKKPEPEQKQPVRTSERFVEKKEKQAAKAAPASSKKAPEETPSVRRSARLAAKNK
jgi:hypothetical protein